MDLPVKLKYDRKTKNLTYYHPSTVHEADITAEVVVVPRKLFDENWVPANKYLPLMATAVYKTKVKEIFGDDNNFKNKNLILISDEIYRLANKKELMALIEHEFGHIFYGHTWQPRNLYRFRYEDPLEVMADTFVGDMDAFNSLEKKYAIYHIKKCFKCGTKMMVDNANKEMPSYYLIYCPKCRNFVWDGVTDPFYIKRRVIQLTK